HQLIYIIIVASLVALSLKAISQKKVEYTDYHIFKAVKESTERHVIEKINLTPNFYKVQEIKK
ncbi:MAG: hypothetical protein KQH67_12820, partial [Bacteroidetes bacterium]|nr:hypothetical protein [Bacteroidota bacterium]